MGDQTVRVLKAFFGVVPIWQAVFPECSVRVRCVHYVAVLNVVADDASQVFTAPPGCLWMWIKKGVAGEAISVRVWVPYEAATVQARPLAAAESRAIVPCPHHLPLLLVPNEALFTWCMLPSPGPVTPAEKEP